MTFGDAEMRPFLVFTAILYVPDCSTYKNRYSYGCWLTTAEISDFFNIITDIGESNL